jgi:hypothetical protein
MRKPLADFAGGRHAIRLAASLPYRGWLRKRLSFFLVSRSNAARNTAHHIERPSRGVPHDTLRRVGRFYPGSLHNKPLRALGFRHGVGRDVLPSAARSAPCVLPDTLHSAGRFCPDWLSDRSLGIDGFSPG